MPGERVVSERRRAGRSPAGTDGAAALPIGFLVAGSQKAGTTSLSFLLDQHPAIQPAPLKEMHYFDDESRDWQRPDHRGYGVVPDRPGARLAGDATPLYLWWPGALERIRDYDPAMRFLVLFRDPVERLFSQWLMTVNRWPRQARPWRRFITGLVPDGLPDRVPAGVSTGGFRMHSGIVRGYYGAQLARGFAMFGRERFHLLEFRAFLDDHATALDGITDFLGVPRFERPPPLPHSMAGKPALSESAPTAADVLWLAETYREDFALFRRLSGLEVSHWPLHRLLAGELDPAELAARFAAKVIAPGRAG